MAPLDAQPALSLVDAMDAALASLLPAGGGTGAGAGGAGAGGAGANTPPAAPAGGGAGGSSLALDEDVRAFFAAARELRLALTCARADASPESRAALQAEVHALRGGAERGRALLQSRADDAQRWRHALARAHGALGDAIGLTPHGQAGEQRQAAGEQQAHQVDGAAATEVR